MLKCQCNPTWSIHIIAITVINFPMGCFAKIENGTLIKLLTREKLNTGPGCKEYYRTKVSHQRFSGGMKEGE